MTRRAGARSRVAARRLLAGLLAGVLATFAVAAGAETLYVVDRLEVGVHETTELDSVILEVVPTRTPLTVLNRAGDFVQVRTPDGNDGWVDGRYLVSNEPAGQSATELQTRLGETARDLGAARAEVEVLRQRLAEARQIGGDPAPDQSPGGDGNEDAARQAREATGRLTKALDELSALAEKNQGLEGEIAELEAMRAAADAERTRQSTAPAPAAQPVAPPVEPPPGASSGFLAAVEPWGVWHWLLFVSLLALAFALGGYSVDWSARKRHGGFRI